METFHQIFGTDAETITWLQMCARAVVVMVYAIILLRMAARRAQGNDTAMDVIVAVIVGSALSRALTGTADLLPTFAATAVLFALHSLVAALAMRFGWFSKLTKGRPSQLIQDGKIDWRRARRALIGEGDLQQELRLQSIARIEDVETAHLERNGRISIVRRQGRPGGR